MRHPNVTGAGRQTAASLARTAAVVVTTLAGLAACAPPQPADTDIALGLLAPLASGVAVAGEPTVTGALMAVDEINAAGGVSVGGRQRRLRLVVESTGDRPEVAITLAFKLIESDGVVALLGAPLSHNAISVARVAEASRVPLLTTLSTHPDTTRGKLWSFRLALPNPAQGRLLAELARSELGADSAAVVVNASHAYSLDLGQAFALAFERLGGTVAAFESFTTRDADLAPQLERVARAGPEVLVLPCYASLLPSLVRQARRHGIRAELLGADTWSALDPAETVEIGAAYFVDLWAPDLPLESSRRFLAGYRARFGHEAKTSAAVAFDAVKLLATAIEQAASTEPGALRGALASLTGFQGVTGDIAFDGSGDPVRTALVRRIGADGRVRLHRRLEP